MHVSCCTFVVLLFLRFTKATIHPKSLGLKGRAGEVLKGVLILESGKLFWRCGNHPHPHKIGRFLSQGALKGTNLRGQTEPKRRFSLIFADSRLFPENKAFGKRRFSQKTADFRREPQKTAGTRRKPQIAVCPLRFVPFSAALLRGLV